MSRATSYTDRVPGSFGARLTEARLAKDLTHAALAELVGCHPVEIAGYETGRRMPRFGRLVCLANVLGVTTDYLLGRDG